MGEQGERFYDVDGLRLPSVTTILSIVAKPALVPWASYAARNATIAAACAVYSGRHTPASLRQAIRQHMGSELPHQALQDAALDIGSLVHQRIESEMRRELGEDVPLVEVPETSPDGSPHKAAVALMAYRSWRAACDVRPVAVEVLVYSKEQRFAGTLDLLAYVKDQLTVVDYKTSKAVYPEYYLQVAAYREAHDEMTDGRDPLGGLILRLPKDGAAFEAVNVPWVRQRELMDAFTATAALWRWNHAQEEATGHGGTAP